MFVEGKPEQSIYIKYRYYGECKNTKNETWTWITNSTKQANNYKARKNMFGMKLLSFSKNEHFYITNRILS